MEKEKSSCHDGIGTLIYPRALSLQLIETENWQTIPEGKDSRKESREQSYHWFARPRFQTQPSLFLFLFISLSSSSKIRIYHDAEYDGNSPNLDH